MGLLRFTNEIPWCCSDSFVFPGWLTSPQSPWSPECSSTLRDPSTPTFVVSTLFPVSPPSTNLFCPYSSTSTVLRGPCHSLRFGIHTSPPGFPVTLIHLPTALGALMSLWGTLFPPIKRMWCPFCLAIYPQTPSPHYISHARRGTTSDFKGRNSRPSGLVEGVSSPPLGHLGVNRARPFSA